MSTSGEKTNLKPKIVKISRHNTSRKSKSELFCTDVSFYETLNLGPQRQKQKQPLNTLASNVLFIYKTKKPPVAVKSEEDRVLTVTG